MINAFTIIALVLFMVGVFLLARVYGIVQEMYPDKKVSPWVRIGRLLYTNKFNVVQTVSELQSSIKVHRAFEKNPDLLKAADTLEQITTIAIHEFCVRTGKIPDVNPKFLLLQSLADEILDKYENDYANPEELHLPYSFPLNLKTYSIENFTHDVNDAIETVGEDQPFKTWAYMFCAFKLLREELGIQMEKPHGTTN